MLEEVCTDLRLVVTMYERHDTVSGIDCVLVEGGTAVKLLTIQLKVLPFSLVN